MNTHSSSTANTEKLSSFNLLETFVREWITARYSHGLTPAQWSALRYVCEQDNEVVTLTGFAKFYGTTLGTASQTISSLENKGLVSRSRHPENHRKVAIKPTELGHRMMQNDPLNRIIDDFRKIDSDDSEIFLDSLNNLIVSLRKIKSSS